MYIYPPPRLQGTSGVFIVVEWLPFLHPPALGLLVALLQSSDCPLKGTRWWLPAAAAN